jgi:hypothetical protein
MDPPAWDVLPRLKLDQAVALPVTEEAGSYKPGLEMNLNRL